MHFSLSGPESERFDEEERDSFGAVDFTTYFGEDELQLGVLPINPTTIQPSRPPAIPRSTAIVNQPHANNFHMLSIAHVSLNLVAVNCRAIRSPKV